MGRRTLVAAVWFALIGGYAWAQDVQSRADALLERAGQMEDIRSPNAAAFRLDATFSFIGADLETLQGTYSETWVSASEWRQETVVDDLRSIVVGGLGKHWILVPEGFPSHAEKLPLVMTFLPATSLKLDFESIRELGSRDLTAECAFTKRDSLKFQSAFCFEKKTGVLLQKVFPETRPRNVVSFSCDYGSFRKFGVYLFPREVACFEDRHKSIRANVNKLSLLTTVDAALFEPPAGAVEIPECSGKMVAPYLVSSGFATSMPDSDRVSWIQVWFMVDAKGKVQNVRALRSLDKRSYKKAVSATQNLSFVPGTCNGKPIAMPVTLELPAP